ncbi:hypothetical protein C6376_37345 [Streptomyces sp. P3]|nr:hypothetical protein C6376_37345 [Streptomyces sp. P3]
MAAQKANEVLHIGSALGQWRILAQHQRHRLRRGHHVIARRRRHLSDGRSPPALSHGLVAVSVRVQRKAHDATPVRIKPK